MRPDIAPGNPFPDSELPDHENVRRKLIEIQGDDPSHVHGWDRRAAGAAS